MKRLIAIEKLKILKPISDSVIKEYLMSGIINNGKKLRIWK